MIKMYEKAREFVLPFTLTLFLCTSIFGIFESKTFTVYNFLSALIILAAFLFCGFLRKHKLAGGLICAVLIVVSLTMASRFIFADDWGSGFFKWFLSGGDDEPSQPRYFFAFLSVFPFFLSLIVYYFSHVLYRTSFLMLSSLIPCAVYVKTLKEINDFYLVCLVGLNAAIFAVNVHKKERQDGISTGKNAYSLSIAVTVCLALVISSLIPKQGEAIYYNIFEKYFMDGGTGQDGNYTTLGKRSGNAESFANLPGTRLYSVMSQDRLYFRRQCFDVYDSEKHCFYPLEKYSQGYYKDANTVIERRKFISLDNMLSAMKTGSKLESSLKLNSGLNSLDKVGDMSSTAEIIPERGHNAAYLITSLRTFAVNSSLNDKAYNITQHGQVNAEKPVNSSQGSYYIEYYKESAVHDIWFDNGGADFTDSEYASYLENLKNVLIENGETELYKTALAFELEFNEAMQYKSDYFYNNAEISEPIVRLAQELTDKYEYDWQKATAIRDYFHSGKFSYDLEYRPPKNMNTAEYFLFTSKCGTCSDFAAAYTLLARSAGLTVRYTEGFSPTYSGEPGKYIILANGLHAYPEVYIPNTGWVVFEPTVSSMYGTSFSETPADNTSDNGLDFTIDTKILFTVIKTVSIIFLAVAAAIISVPAALKIYDKIRIKKGGAEGLILAYRRISSAMSRKLKIKTDALTPHELCELVLAQTGFDLREFVCLYEQTCFGGIIPNKEQSEFAYQTFKSALKCKKIK